MRLDRLTTKTREALVAAQQNAADRGNPEVYPEHLLLDLLRKLFAEADFFCDGECPRTADRNRKERKNQEA